MDWRKPLRNGPEIPLAPTVYDSDLRGFINEHLVPALPPVELALAWHQAVLEHADKHTSTLLVRATPGYKQEESTDTRSGRTLVMTDNAPPWWMHAVAFSRLRPPPTGLEAVLDEVWCWMFRAHKGGVRFPGNANKAGWYVAHILQAKPPGDGAPEEWEDETARRRFLRNVSPLNQFLVPKGNGQDVGERREVISTIADFYRERFGATFDTFLEAAGALPGEIDRPQWDAAIRMRRSSASESGAEVTPMVQGARHRRVVRKGATTAPTTSTWWSAVLAGGRHNPRLDILAAAPDAQRRLDALKNGLTVEQVVGISNALFNQCDPTDLRAEAPASLRRQAEIAWAFLMGAKRSPRLGGKWLDTVVALEKGSDRGLLLLLALKFDAFFTAIRRVESAVYRKI